LKSAKAALEESNAKVSSLELQLTESKEEAEKTKQENGEFNGRISTLEKDLQQKIAEFEDFRKTAETREAAAKAQHEAAMKDSEEKKAGTADEHEAEIKGFETAIKEKDAEIDNLKKKIETNQSQLADLQAKLKDATATQVTAASFDAAASAMTGMPGMAEAASPKTAKIQELQSELQKAQIATRNAEHAKVQTANDGLKNEVDLLQKQTVSPQPEASDSFC